MELQRTKNKVHLARFDSMTAMVEYSNPDIYDKLSEMDRNEYFVGKKFFNWEHVVNETKAEWNEGLEVLKAFVERLEKMDFTEIKSVRRVQKYTYDEGDEVDLDRLQQGQPFMRKTERDGEVVVPTLTVFIDTTTAGNMDPDDILWRGAAGVALTKLLEAKGYAVELWCVNGSTLFVNDPKPVMTACCLKRTTDPLDISTLINTVSGWFYRSATFNLLRTICEKNNQVMHPALGYPYEPDQLDLDALSDDPVRIYSSGVYSFSGACRVIEDELKRIKENSPKSDETQS